MRRLWGTIFWTAIWLLVSGCSGFSNSSHETVNQSLNTLEDQVPVPDPQPESEPEAEPDQNSNNSTDETPDNSPGPTPSPMPSPENSSSEEQAENLPELMAALNSASAGDTISLKSGSYGDLKINDKIFSSHITIKSSNPEQPARFQSIEVNNSKYIRFKSIHVDHSTNGLARKGLINIVKSDYIEVLDSEINGSVQNPRDLSKYSDYIAVEGRFQSGYGIQAREGSDHVVIRGNFIHDIETGAVFFGVSRLKVSHNQFEYIGGDCLKFGGVYNSEISYNIGAKYVITEPDMHIDFIQFQGSSGGIKIQGNVLVAGKNNKNGVHQGIFINNGTYNDFEITDNLIYTNTVNAIFLNSTDSSGVATGNNLRIERNTVLSQPDYAKWDSAEIRLIKFAGNNFTIRNNIVDRIDNNVSGGTVTNNPRLQFKDSSQSNYYDKVYVNATAGTLAELEDFTPVSGGLGDFGSGMGAEETLQYFLNQ